jgi:hypothetical protein
VRLILLSHYDDEIFLLPTLLKKTENLVVIYTTNSLHPKTMTDSSRMEECRLAWRAINPSAQIIFFGFDNNILDGRLHLDVNSIQLEALLNMVLDLGITSISTLSPEGGHQDHDFTFAIADFLAQKTHVELTHFSAYRKRSSRRNKGFAVMSPELNCSCRDSSVLERHKLIRLYFFLIFRAYQSQWKTWVALGPFVFLKLLRGEVPRHTCGTVFPRPETACLWVVRRRAVYRDFIEALDVLKPPRESVI